MTDMATGLGATASCPNCGAQVQVTQVDGPTVTCPDCGTAVPTGVRAEVATDVTRDELERAFGANGYDTDVSVVEGGLECGGCGTVSDAGSWQVDDLRRGSDAVGGGEVVVGAVVCPSCGALGRAVLGEGLDDADSPATAARLAFERARRDA